MAITWTDLEDALRAGWFLPATGLPSTSVYWGAQAVNQPTRPFATLQLRGPVKLGGVLDAVDAKTNLSNPAGQEVELTTQGQREVTLSCQVFSAAVTGALQAREYLGKAQTALSRQSVQDAFAAAGLALREVGAVIDVPETVETGFISRAAMDVRFGLVDVDVEKTGYIATVELVDLTEP